MDELKEYVQKTAKDKLLLGVFGAAFGAAAYVLYLRHSRFLFGAMLLCAAVLLAGALTGTRSDRKFLDSIENSPERDAILADFRSARPCADDAIRMGECYIFSKKTTVLYRYAEIRQMQYFERYDTEARQTEAGIVVTLTSGATRSLCSLPDADPRSRAQEIFSIVLSENPDVEIRT